jgi:hypothetical protein
VTLYKEVVCSNGIYFQLPEDKLMSSPVIGLVPTFPIMEDGGTLIPDFEEIANSSAVPRSTQSMPHSGLPTV